MIIPVLFIGLFIGVLISISINRILTKMFEDNKRNIDFFSIAAYEFCFLTAYIKFGFNILFVRVIILTGLLVVISFVDLKTRIIPDFMVIITLVLGIILSCIGGSSLWDSIIGMLTGGAVLFILALIPNAMGGGDIKLMFAVGTFLGFSKTLWAIVIAFMIASVIGLLLLMFKVIGRKDHIPFGPFLALGSFISLMIFI